MNRELMEKWIAALRSGKYEQGRSYLCRHDPETGHAVAYCCLGVLQDIEPCIEDDKDGDELLDEETLQEFLGVGRSTGFRQATYAEWNDEGMPFPEIADKLERRWLKQEDKS